MTREEIVVPGNPGIVLARVAPLIGAWFGRDGCVLGGGTVLAARWHHRVSTDIDLFTERERYTECVASRRKWPSDWKPWSLRRGRAPWK